MDTPPIPPQPAAWPDLINDELPLLTETVGEPVIPVLSERVPAVPPLLSEVIPPEPAPLRAAAPSTFAAPPHPADAPPVPSAAEPMAQIERELQAAARLIMQQVIDDYMLQIEAELHRRLEDHLASLLRAGRR